MEMSEKKKQAVIRNYRRGQASLVLRTTLGLTVVLGSFYAAITLVENGFTERALTALFGIYAMSAIGGALMGLVMWIDLERNFLKLKMQAMQKKLADSGSTNWRRWPDEAS